jgi:alcohol dehydrogenase (NADP+)
MKLLNFKNGDTIPIVGLGTWKSKPGEVKQAVIWAIEAGYRHIDCAAVYGNEEEVGEAIAQAITQGTVKREDLHITSKLWNDSHPYDHVIPALKKTLKDLQLDYIDEYLIHWPISFKHGVGFPKSREDFLTYQEVPLELTWKAMQEAKEMKLVKHIGVSNFNISKLDVLLAMDGEAPEMLQVEMHPYLPQDELVNFCRENGLLLTAYSPLGSPDSRGDKHQDDPKLLSDSVVLEIAAKHQIGAGQVLIAWSVSRDIAVIPKSVHQQRIKENLDAASVELDDQDLMELSAIGIAHRFIDGSIFTGENSPYNRSDLFEK